MAQELMKKKNKGRHKITSAGLFVNEGDLASENAIQVLKEDYKIRPRKHKARQVTKEILRGQDLILTMTSTHKEKILSSFPDLEDRVYTLKEYVYKGEGNPNIEDPYGGDLDLYKRSGQAISEALDRLLEIIS